jgi:hypothetical protein
LNLTLPGCCCKLLQGARALLYMPLAVIIYSL